MKKIKVISAFALAVILVLSMTLTCYAADSEEKKTTNRYYFYQPEIWKNEYSETVGIYWWEGDEPCQWPGVEAHKSDVEGVYYYDVPTDVGRIIWTNLVDGGLDKEAEIYNCANETTNICSEFYFPDESPAYPNGTESFDGMIYVVDLTNYRGSFWEKTAYNGEWYYYYGNGEYGLTPEKGEFFCRNSFLEEPLEIGEFAIYDVNADGSINVKDATDIQKYCAKIIDFDDGQIKRTNAWVYDWDGNFLGYNVTVKNATLIQKFVANFMNNSGIIDNNK